MKMYGSHLCPDSAEAFDVLEKKGVSFDFLDISEDLSNLKAFLKIRESSPLFDAVRSADGIGIPCFEKDSGEITLNVEEVLG